MSDAPSIVVIGRIVDDAMEALAAMGTVTELADADSDSTIIDHCANADAIVIRTRQLPVEAIERASKLRVIARHGVGYNNLPVDALNAHRIPLGLVGDVNAQAVAEHTLFLILAASRHAEAQLAACRNNDFGLRNRQPTREMHSKTIVVFGFGKIGKMVAGMAHAFAMKVRVYDPFVTEEIMADYPDYTAHASLAEACQNADYLTLHAPLTEQTHGIITHTVLEQLAPTATVINTARGELIDEAELLRALDGGTIAAAALDVLCEEPPAADAPLVVHPKVLVTPHSAALTKECFLRMGMACVQNVQAGLYDRADAAFRRRLVNPQVLEL